MSAEEYWIGRDVDYDRVWRDFEDGLDYIDKFRSMRVHLIRIELRQYPADLPLFNHEAILKTLKGYFHDLKENCLTHDEYQAAGPLFFYSAERGSGIWSFLGELRQLVMLGTTLADEKTIGQKLDNMDKRLQILQKYFGESVNPNDFQQFMRATTPRQIESAIQKLVAQGISRIEISQAPFNGNIHDTQKTLVDIGELLQVADGKIE